MTRNRAKRGSRWGTVVIREAESGGKWGMDGYSGGEGIDGARDSCGVWARVDDSGWSDVYGWVAGEAGAEGRADGDRAEGQEVEDRGAAE